MLRTLLNLLAGYRTVAVPASHTVQALNLLQASGYPHWRMQNGESGGISFRMRLRDAQAYLQLCDGYGIAAEAGRIRGIPELLRRYAGRWGIPTGAVLFGVIVWLSTTVVWRMEVTGNERYSDTEIVGMLCAYGFGVGSRFSGIDFDVLQNGFLRTADGIAWIAVNMQGTTAHVEVRETLDELPERERSSASANIVASEDGQITEVRVSGGRAVVGVNDIVRKGELLISGIMTVGEDGLRYEYASGQVFAKVNRQVTGEAALTQEKNVYTGQECTRRSVLFFGKEIKFFRKSGIEYPSYDTIISENQMTLPDGTPLPVWIRTETQRAFRVETVTLSETEAYYEALRLYQTRLKELLSDAELLSMEMSASMADGVCRIVGQAVCLADIAATLEIPLH